MKISKYINIIILYSFIKFTLSQDCSLINDCFNCTRIKTCRWDSSNELCISYEQSNPNFSINNIDFSHYNNLTLLNNYFNFIRNACFLQKTPMMNNNINSKYYNYQSVEYCGEHYIMTTELELRKLKIELNKINGYYSLPNLLCEYIFFSGPNSFEINIQIDQKESNNFYFLYSSDSLNFYRQINTSTKINIEMTPNKLNTLIFYSLKSFNSSPFSITFKQNFWSETVKITGYIMLALIIIILAVIIFAIINMRKNSSLFKKNSKNKKISYDKEKGEEIALMKKTSNETNIIGPSIIKNFTPSTPMKFLEKENFPYDKCALDGLYFNNKEDIYETKCGHFYHKNCFNKLVEKMKESKDNKELKCVICQQNIEKFD